MTRRDGEKGTTRKKKTTIGNSKFTKRGQPGPHGGNKKYTNGFN